MVITLTAKEQNCIRGLLGTTEQCRSRQVPLALKTRQALRNSTCNYGLLRLNESNHEKLREREGTGYA
jgi:hypothetical protein